MKKIAIIGASYLQLPLVQKCKEMGIETHCFAWEEGAVCKEISDYFYPVSIIDKEQILKICKEIGIDGITSIASDVAVPTVCYVSEKMDLIGNTFQSSVLCTNKYLMRTCFLDNNIASPRFIVANDLNSIGHLKFPLIVKPTDRSGSRGVQRIDIDNELKHAIDRAKVESFSKEVIIEEFISGQEISVESISWKGKHYIITITDKVTSGEPYFVELEHHQPSLLSKDIIDNVKDQTIKALNALGVNYGASHTEFKISNEGKLFIIEIGARMGGDFIGSDLVFLSTGYDYLKSTINIALGQFEMPQMLDEKYSGVYFLSKETERLLQIIQNTGNYNEILVSEITDTELHYVKCSADRSGYFIYQSGKKFKI